MNSPDADNQTAPALAALFSWLGTLRTDRGYGGPAIGPRAQSMRFCGPGNDWRWEGLLDAWMTLAADTPSAPWLGNLEWALHRLVAAQLPDGTFPNSSFEHNPFEGGMPHEAAVMAAVCRARQCLLTANAAVPDGVDGMLERYVNAHLLRELWSKQLRTFNDWLQSDFERYRPVSVAAAVDLLIHYGDIAGDAARLEPFITGAGQSLLDLQWQRGDGAGGMPESNAPGDGCAPYNAARCLPVMDRLHALTGRDEFRGARDALAGFLVRTRVPRGGHASYVTDDGAVRTMRPFVGGTAMVLRALALCPDCGPSRKELAPQVTQLAACRTPSGAFPTTHDGASTPGQAAPDWRGRIPCSGWEAHVASLLALWSPAALPEPETDTREEAVTVDGYAATLAETDTAITIARPDAHTLYHWRKTASWAEVCRL